VVEEEIPQLAEEDRQGRLFQELRE
jgi:hypothetical protein